MVSPLMVVIKMGAYIHGVLVLCGFILPYGVNVLNIYY